MLLRYVFYAATFTTLFFFPRYNSLPFFLLFTYYYSLTLSAHLQTTEKTKANKQENTRTQKNSKCFKVAIRDSRPWFEWLKRKQRLPQRTL